MTVRITYRREQQSTLWSELTIPDDAPAGTDTIERQVIWVPGFDCRHGCTHTPKIDGNHGQHGDELHAVVRSRILEPGMCTPLEFASSLAVFTQVRDGEPWVGYERLTMPASVSMHCSHPEDRAEMGSLANRASACDYLWSKNCFSGSMSALQANEIWDKYVEIDFGPELLVAGACADRLLEVERVWSRLVAWHHREVRDLLAKRKTLTLVSS